MMTSLKYSLQGKDFQVRPIPADYKDTICEDSIQVAFFTATICDYEKKFYLPLVKEFAELYVLATDMHMLYHAGKDEKMN